MIACIRKIGQNGELFARIRIRAAVCGEDLPSIPASPFQIQVHRDGVGLSIVAKIVKNHLGYVQAESKKGEGAVFTVWLPLKFQGNRGMRGGV